MFFSRSFYLSIWYLSNILSIEDVMPCLKWFTFGLYNLLGLLRAMKNFFLLRLLRSRRLLWLFFERMWIWRFSGFEWNSSCAILLPFLKANIIFDEKLNKFSLMIFRQVCKFYSLSRLFLSHYNYNINGQILIIWKPFSYVQILLHFPHSILATLFPIIVLLLQVLQKSFFVFQLVLLEFLLLKVWHDFHYLSNSLHPKFNKQILLL